MGDNPLAEGLSPIQITSKNVLIFKVKSVRSSDLKKGGVFFLGKIQRRRVSALARVLARVRARVCVFHEQCMFESIFSRIAYIYNQENILIMTTESRYGKSCLI